MDSRYEGLTGSHPSARGRADVNKSRLANDLRGRETRRDRAIIAAGCQIGQEVFHCWILRRLGTLRSVAYSVLTLRREYSRRTTKNATQS